MNLKNRLSSNFCFNQNMQSYNAMMMQQMMNFMNRINFINQMNDYNKMMNINTKNSVENLTLDFSFINNIKIKIQCRSNEKMKSVIQRFWMKYGNFGNNSFIFVFNGKKINDNLTVEESGLYNNGIIYVIDKKDEAQIQNFPEMSISDKNMMILVFSSADGKKIIIKIDEDARVSEAIRKYCNQLGIGNNESDERHLSFLFNGQKISNNDDRKIKDVFENNNIILVIDPSYIIGA